MRFLFILTISTLSVFTFACSDNNQASSIEQKNKAELFKLAHMNGCIDCHRVDATVVGPSWKAIAERYKDAPKLEARALLIESTKKGSVGKWATWKGGNGMPPMENRVSADTIEQLIDYILSLNDSVTQ